MHRRHFLSSLAALAALPAAFLLPLTASANIVMPTLGFFWPPFWFLLLPIILIESWVMVRTVDLTWGRSIKVVAGANLVSTFLGMPAATLILVGLDYTVTGLRPLPPDNWLQWLYVVTVQSTGVIFFREIDESIATAMMVSTVALFFLSSVLVEYGVARMMLKEADRSRLRKGSWLANLASYCMIGGLMIFGIDTFWRSLLNWIYG